MISKLESLGFANFYSRRIGPCSQCLEVVKTYYLPEIKAWLCEHCFESDQSNIEFNNILFHYTSENNMASMNTEQRLQALEQALAARDAELQALKAKSTDNVYVGGTDNLSIKYRQVGPRNHWGIPSKDQNGATYFTSRAFPLNYFLSQDGTKLVLHQEIPITPHEAELFKQRFLMQQMVQIKRQDRNAPPVQSTTPPSTVPGVSTPTTVTPSTTKPSATVKRFTDLSADERKALQDEAKGLSDTGLYTLPEALASVLESHHISK